MCNKAVNTSPSAMQFISEYYKTKEMCVQAVDFCPFVFNSVLDLYTTQEMCHNAVFNYPFILQFCLDRYKTQEMCDKAVDDFLPALKCVPSWFVTSKMIRKLFHALITDDILFFDKDSGNATFSNDEMGILSVDLNNISLD